MWQSFISSVLHSSLWYAVLLLNLLKHYSIILGVPGAAIISKLQSCNYCCLLASSRSGAANSSHSRLHLLQGFSKHRLHAILVTFVFTCPKILCNLCQLMLEMKIPFLFNICFPHTLPFLGRDCCPFLTVENHSCVFSFSVSLCATGVTVLSDRVGAAALLGLAAELLLSWDTISVSHRSCLSTVSLCPPSTSAPTAVYRHKQHAAMEQMVADHSLQVSELSNSVKKLVGWICPKCML